MNIHGADASEEANTHPPEPQDDALHRLWYRESAAEWDHALPIGNGRIGAMCFGRPLDDVIALNDDRAWSGSPASESGGGLVDRGQAAQALAEARSAMQRGDVVGAEKALRRLQQRYSQAYLPLGELRIHVGGTASLEYQRELDLRTGVHRHQYQVDGYTFTQESFVTGPDQALVVTISTDSPAGVNLRVGLEAPHVIEQRLSEQNSLGLVVRLPSDVSPPHEPDQPPARWDDGLTDAMRIAIALAADSDGQQIRDGDALVLNGVHRAAFVLTTETSFEGYGRELSDNHGSLVPTALSRADIALALGREALRARHVADHWSLYGRVELALDGDRDADGQPTDERLRRAIARAAASHSPDPRLLALLFHYGRYLLVASSRRGTLASNLQGIWNDRMRPPWSSNYTVNINTEMNYWGAEVGNLRELHEPLFDLVEALAVRGADTASRLYDAPGWVAHHNSDIWGHTSPVGLGRGDLSWAWWPMAGAWLATHFGTHLEFGWDEGFARERAWPVVSACARFLLSWLDDQEGLLGTALSTSPENCYRLDDGSRGSVAPSATMDLALIRAALRLVVDLDNRLGLSSELAVASRVALQRLLPPGVSDDGRILEWPRGLPDWEPQHRHVSHLFGVYPGAEQWDERLTSAARRSLDARGNDASGWSLTWKIALRSRLRQPQVVQDLLCLFFREPDFTKNDSSGSLLPNLLQTSPPFQIDANLGLVGALAESFLQSHAGVIELLPALPTALASGHARGLVARPGLVVDLRWSDGELEEVVLTPRQEASVTIRYRGRDLRLSVHTGVPVRFTDDDF